MSMCAEIIAVGPYSRQFVDYLEYPLRVYDQLNEGAIITERLFGILEGSSMSRKLAGLLGIHDPWDFNQHKIKNENIDLVGLREFAELYDNYMPDFNKLVILKDFGFEFHFRPEG